jgi:hypothetical protein
MLQHQQSNPRVCLFFDSYSCCFGQIISCQGSVAFSSDSCHRQGVTGCRIFFSMAGAIFQLVDPAGTIIHEYAAMPVGTVRRIELYSFDTYIFAFSLFYLFINLLFFL